MPSSWPITSSNGFQRGLIVSHLRKEPRDDLQRSLAACYARHELWTLVEVGNVAWKAPDRLDGDQPTPGSFSPRASVVRKDPRSLNFDAVKIAVDILTDSSLVARRRRRAILGLVLGRKFLREFRMADKALRVGAVVLGAPVAFCF